MSVTPTKAIGVAPTAFDIQPSDTLDISLDSNNTRAYRSCVPYCKATGNIKVVTADGDTITFSAVPAYTKLPVSVKQVFSTGTTGSWVGLVFTQG